MTPKDYLKSVFSVMELILGKVGGFYLKNIRISKVETNARPPSNNCRL